MDGTIKPIDLFTHTGVEKNLHDMMLIGMKPRVAFRNPPRWAFVVRKLIVLLTWAALVVLLFKLLA
jgi:hypothetical protein